MSDSDDEFIVPTGDELDRGEVEGRRRRRLLRRRSQEDERSSPRRPERRLEVPDDVGTKGPAEDGLLDTGASGRVVRSVSASSAAARREFVVPEELREKYGLRHDD